MSTASIIGNVLTSNDNQFSSLRELYRISDFQFALKLTRCCLTHRTIGQSCNS
uniref:Uncharacterized protein n=1 Tax=Octopus bimaculoides TaxID=37653 RepID=A0A0L8H020_OCTBM